MAITRELEGTWAELEPYAKQRPAQRFRLTPLEPCEDSDVKEAHDSLADWLGDFIGVVEGKGEHDASEMKQVIAGYIANKHREGRL